MDWFYADTNHQQQGPVTEARLIELIQSGEVPQSSLVWREGMGDWVPASQVLNLPVSNAMSPSQTPAEPGMVPETPPAVSNTLPESVGPPIPSGTVPTYLWQSIVCVVLCCWPLAVPAIIFACKVDPALKRGDLAAAQEASRNAKGWCIASFIAGLLVFIFIVVVGILDESGAF